MLRKLKIIIVQLKWKIENELHRMSSVILLTMNTTKMKKELEQVVSDFGILLILLNFFFLLVDPKLLLIHAIHVVHQTMWHCKEIWLHNLFLLNWSNSMEMQFHSIWISCGFANLRFKCGFFDKQNPRK